MAYDMGNVPSFPTKHKVLTPNDDVEFDYPTSILVIDGGDVAIADEDGTIVVYEDVPAWTVIPVIAAKLMDTDTVATKFVGIFGEQG